MTLVRAAVTSGVRTRRYVLLLLAVALAVLGPSLWRAAPLPIWVFSAHRRISKEMAARKIPGLSIAVAYRGGLRWSSAYGLADIEDRVPARAETVYRWASISETITAVALLQLAERGRLDLDSPVQKYAPGFPEKRWPVTSRQLLGHLGGIRDFRGDERESVRHCDKIGDALALFANDPLDSEPGTKHLDSPHGYNLLGVVAEGASGKAFIEQVDAEIFHPANMTSPHVDDLETLIPHRCRGYKMRPDGTLANARPIDGTNRIPGAGFCGTVEDLARFVLALESGSLLNRKSREAMLTRGKTRDGKPIDFGLGWNLTTRSGREEVWRDGRMEGVSAMLYVLPDRKFSVAIIANLEGVELLELARSIADIAAPTR